MVDNLTTRAVLKDKLSGAATDILTKLDHTVQNLGKQKPTEGAPINYKVTHKGGALVRSGYETTTSQVHQLAVGEVVTIVELVGRRARIIAPVEGWVSTETKDGVQIMRQCHMQRKAAQNEAFEHMFEQKFSRLKAQQGGPVGGGGAPSYSQYDPRTEHSISRSASPEDYPPHRSDSDRDDGRWTDRNGGRQGGQDGGKRGSKEPDPAFVPRLAAPGSSSRGPVILSPPAQSGGLGPPPSAGGRNTAGSAVAAPASADLLSMDDGPPARGSAPAQSQPAAFDPFGDFGGPAGPSGMQPQAAQAPLPAQAAQEGFTEFEAFQSAPPARGMGGGMQQPGGMLPVQQQQAAVGNLGVPYQDMMGWPGAQSAPAMGTAGTGWPQQQQQQQLQQQQMAFGMGMGQMPGGMGQMATGQMAMPQGLPGQMAMGMGMAQGSQLQSNMGAGGMPGFGAGQMGPQMGVPGATMGGSASAFGAAANQGSNVDDLMSRAMQGVANMSFEQRVATQTAGVGQQVPMNMMAPRTR